MVLVIDVTTGECRYANAGHPPPVLTDGVEHVPLVGTGPLLGAFAATWATETVVIEPGRTLILYTDGVTEAVNASRERFGEQRLADGLRTPTITDAAGLVDRVIAAVDDFRDGPRSDDVTVLVVHRSAEPLLTHRPPFDRSGSTTRPATREGHSRSTHGYSAVMTESASPLVITPTDSGFSVSGEIDAHTAPEIAAAISGSTVEPLRIDLSGVEFVDSSGLRVLIEAHQARQAEGRSMTLVRPSNVVTRLFDIAGVDQYLDIAHETRSSTRAAGRVRARPGAGYAIAHVEQNPPPPRHACGRHCARRLDVGRRRRRLQRRRR